MSNKQIITIKGTKDGLTFLLDDSCSFEVMIEELKNVLGNSHNSILSGPLMHVLIKSGYRKMTSKQQNLIKEIFKSKGNLLVRSIENEIEVIQNRLKSQVKVINGIIRSGQISEIEGNVLLLGDVNPGGNLLATGDIYILGALRGIAHAGIKGDKNSIIISSKMKPQQLRIADIYCRQDDFKEDLAKPEVAFVKGNDIIIEYFQHFNKLKGAFGTFI